MKYGVFRFKTRVAKAWRGGILSIAARYFFYGADRSKVCYTNPPVRMTEFINKKRDYPVNGNPFSLYGGGDQSRTDE